MALVTLTRQGETLVVDDSVIDQYLFAGWSVGDNASGVIESDTPPSDDDGRPDGTVYLYGGQYRIKRGGQYQAPSVEQAAGFRRALNVVGVSSDGDVALPDGSPLFRAMTWAELQALPALGNVNRKVFVTDIGINGSEWVSDGAAWRPLGPITLVAEHQAQVVTDATADETDVFTYLIPAGILTRASLLKIYPAWTFPSSAATKVVRVLVGGVEAFSKSRTTTTHEVPIVEMMTQDGPTSAKFLLNPSGAYGSGQSGTMVSGAIDLNEPIQIRATSKWGAAAAGSNSITFHKCIVVLEY